MFKNVYIGWNILTQGWSDAAPARCFGVVSREIYYYDWLVSIPAI